MIKYINIVYKSLSHKTVHEVHAAKTAIFHLLNELREKDIVFDNRLIFDRSIGCVTIYGQLCAQGGFEPHISQGGFKHALHKLCDSDEVIDRTQLTIEVDISDKYIDKFKEVFDGLVTDSEDALGQDWFAYPLHNRIVNCIYSTFNID